MPQRHGTLTTLRMWKSWKAYKGRRLDSWLETGKGLREPSQVSWQTWNGPLSSPRQSPETEHTSQGPNWRDSFASARPCHSPAANHQEPSRQANDPNQYIYGYIQIQLLAKNHHVLERHTPRHHSGRAVFLKKNVMAHLMWLDEVCVLAAPIHLYYMFLTNCTKWHNLGVMLPSFAQYSTNTSWVAVHFLFW